MTVGSVLESHWDVKRPLVICNILSLVVIEQDDTIFSKGMETVQQFFQDFYKLVVPKHNGCREGPHLALFDTLSRRDLALFVTELVPSAESSGAREFLSPS